MSDNTNDRVMLWYKQLGGYKEGHFQLSSGLHSNVYLQSALVLKNPHMSSILGRYLALEFSDTRVHTVLTAAVGGLIIGQDTARELCAAHIFAERKDDYFTLRRGFTIEPQEKVLIIEDVITTGQTTRELISLVEEHLGRVVGVGCLIDRSAGKLNFGIPVRSLAQIEAQQWEPDNCPECRDGKAFVYPGTRYSNITTG